MSEADSPKASSGGPTMSQAWETLSLDETNDLNPVESLRSEHLPATYVSIDAPHKRSEISLESDLSIGPMIGQGGMGVVRLARQRSLDRDVAVKRLHDGATNYASNALIREAQIMGQLEHPNVIPVHALTLDEEKRPSMVMKRVEGTSWRKIITDANHPSWKDKDDFSADHLVRNIEVLIEISKAVGFAHRRGVIHRDIKPANVMIGAFGEVYLLDWGIAMKLEEQLTTPFELVGTPAYMAPEQVSGDEQFSFATDIYLLGACLHEIITGRPPHLESNIRATFESAFHSKPPSYANDIPQELVDICHTAMHHDAEHRYKDAIAFRTALKAFVAHQSSARLAKTATALFDQTLVSIEANDSSSTMASSFREAEFAFEQARIDWPENPIALAGLKRLLLVRSEFKLERNELEGVEDELKTLDALHDSEDKETNTGVERIRERLAALKAEKKEADPRVSSKLRLVFMIGIMFVATVGSLLQVEFIMKDLVDYGASWLFELALAHNLVQLIGIYLLRHRLMNTAYNRRVAMVEIITAALVLVHRGAAVGLGLPVSAIFAGDMVILAATTFFVGIFIKMPLFWWGIPWIGGALAMPAFPDRGGEIFIIAASCNVLAAVFTRWIYETKPSEET